MTKWIVLLMLMASTGEAGSAYSFANDNTAKENGYEDYYVGPSTPTYSVTIVDPKEEPEKVSPGIWNMSCRCDCSALPSKVSQEKPLEPLPYFPPVVVEPKEQH